MIVAFHRVGLIPPNVYDFTLADFAVVALGWLLAYALWRETQEPEDD